ncbi:precorrin-6y C5,15-methyltransferase (decarboxylating) subunit CbiE [Mycolicibacter sp. MYC123]|uniref:Precorrin-6y C5,15-methyltransferase (Decarboxylating) subunit CbiE n=1 Tax=[Mycobacterium] zoologicum TaxID=2872311 RepID=A0ABU5YQI0_9MYCO|nr:MULTISPECIES: precorrin-6y C5,15-methyltransferase (decarboxylating) subunit CbiE [unclassified Mycolicibacter]MEB3052332.1 precorrin-6y C5,15-methyltransferase (decarboxylating) subunit CbiE [Mycolicibacter sp. MYC123]MEB3063992.1 precorrin-6y C5,15-methyltransferase (decarboxylating) subunit CbiE [Mycolicibacter sp. MYC101]
MPERITVVGIGADGWAGLSEDARAAITAAGVVIGAPRHLEMLPAVDGQTRRSWPSQLRAGLPALFDGLAGPVVALASGDPLRSGVATTLIEVFGADAVTVFPALSSVTLARARLGWSAESTAVIRAGDEHAVLRELAPGRRVLVLSADETTPARVAGLLVGRGYGASRMTVLGELGGDAESRLDMTAETFTGAMPRLNIVALELAGPPAFGWAPGLPDDAYDHDGQLTKRDLRASALARLAPAPGQLLWDVGAGAGSVGIEWMRAHPTCRTVAVEANPDRAQRISNNARNLGVPALKVVRGAAPDALMDLPQPDAVFVGGGLSRPGVLSACLAALRAGGRLVAHAVTLETEALLAQAYREHGGELTRIQVEHAAPLGSFTGWKPARAVTQWALTLP